MKAGRAAAATAAEPRSCPGPVGNSASSPQPAAPKATSATEAGAGRKRPNGWNRMGWPAFDDDGGSYRKDFKPISRRKQHGGTDAGGPYLPAPAPRDLIHDDRAAPSFLVSHELPL